MNLGFLFILLLCLTVIIANAAPPGQVTDRIMIDQFGYLPEMVKVAVISDPQQGFNAPAPYTPGTTLEVRKISTNELVFSGAVTAWKNGTIHDQSGAREPISSYANSLPINEPDLFADAMRLTRARAGRYNH